MKFQEAFFEEQYIEESLYKLRLFN